MLCAAAPSNDGTAMRNGFLGSILLLVLAIVPAPAQSPPAVPNVSALPSAGAPDVQYPVGGNSWQSFAPPGTSCGDDRPNLSPPGYRFYGNVDYIMWWTEKEHPIPPLSLGSAGNTGNITVPPQNDFGALFRNGLRGDLGMWLNSQQSVGLELGGFWVDDRSPASEFQVGDLSGRMQLHNELCGAEAQLRAEAYRGTWAHFDVLAGFQFLSLDEALGIDEHNAAADVVAADLASTHNRFYGGQLGGELFFHYEKWFLDLWGKGALGVNAETFEAGATTVVGGKAVAGGVLASPAIAGTHHHDAFAFMPEVGVNGGYEYSQHLRFYAGYTFLYLTSAARPGAQIDTILRLTEPSLFPFQSSNFWVQGLNLGAEFRF
jgi:Putative beta barrel porin-7 (BBP7)